MAADGTENLIPMSERSKDEVKKIAAKGGVNSGKTRRKRKAMREQAELLLSMPFQDIKVFDAKTGNIKSLLKEFEKVSGLKADEIDNQMAAVISVWQTVLKGGMGSTNAFNALRDLVGEKPKEVIEIHSTDETIKELDKIIDEKKGKENGE